MTAMDTPFHAQDDRRTHSGMTRISGAAGRPHGAVGLGGRAGLALASVTPQDRERAIEMRIATCESRIRSIDDRWSAGVGRSSELADRATDLADRAIALAARQALEHQLHQARSALQRACQGLGDTCEACGARIAQARLDAVPGTTMCVECQQESERRRL